MMAACSRQQPCFSMRKRRDKRESDGVLNVHGHRNNSESR